MNRVQTITFRLIVACLVWLCLAGGMTAQASSPQESKKPADSKSDTKKAEEDPFAPDSAPPLPAGMTGSDASDPRAKLTPGMYDAGEISKGMKHLLLLKKPGPFQLDSANPDNSKVQKTLGMLGVGDPSKMPK